MMLGSSQKPQDDIDVLVHCTKGTTTSSAKHVIGLSLGYRAGPSEHQDQNDVAIYSRIRSAINALPALRIVVLHFDFGYAALQRITELVPALREPLSATLIAYRFLCKRSDTHPFTEVPQRYFHDGVSIDPFTMQPTGTYAFFRSITPMSTD